MRTHGDALQVLVRPDEQCVALTRDYRLFQPTRGHRYSVDDMAVAHWACTRTPAPRRALDLGCGLGSVLLMTAWAHPCTRLVGIEAHPPHAALARRNVVLNGCESRAEILLADLRQPDLLASLGPFDLVTVTPPYFLPHSATPSPHADRAHAYWELRGGIEEYLTAAAQALTPQGFAVGCAAATPSDRLALAAQRARLCIVRQQDLIPREGREPFLRLWVAVPASDSAPMVEPPLVLRDSRGMRTPAHIAMREWFGLSASVW